ncbi:MAG: MFS transporter [Candidatus Eisenbacteria bacterium]
MLYQVTGAVCSAPDSRRNSGGRRPSRRTGRIVQIDKKTLRRKFLLPIYLSSAAEGICLTITMFFIPLHVRRTVADTSLFTIAAIVAIPSVAVFLARNFWGALADYTKRFKPFLLLGLAGYAGCLFALRWAHGTVSVIAVCTLGSLFFAAVTPMLQSYVTLLREGEKGRAVGDLMAYQSAGWFVGGIACGYLFEPVTGLPVRTILVGSSIFVVAVLLVVALVLEPMPGLPQEGRDLRREASWIRGLASDLEWLYRSKALAATCLLAGLSAGGVWLFFGNFSLFVVEYLRGSTALMGWAMSLSTVFGIFAFSPSGRLADRIGPIKVLLIAVISYSLIYSLVSLTRNPLLAALYFCIPIYPLFNVGVITLVSEVSGESRRAGGLGVLGGVQALSIAGGTLAGGAVASHSGLGMLPRWTVILQIACLIAMFLYIRVFRVLSFETGRRGRCPVESGEPAEIQDGSSPGQD